MPSILPVLVNATEFDLKRFASRYLVDCDRDVPVVAYLRSGDDGNASYITWKAISKKTGGIDHLDARAMKALSNRADRPGWDPLNVDYQDTEVTILVRTGDYLTGSDILDPEILEIVHNYFQSEVIHVSVPHTACMIASDSADYIAQRTAEEYSNAVNGEHEELFCQAYRIEGGEIKEVVDFEPPPPPPEFRTIKGRHVLWFTVPYKGEFQPLYDNLLVMFDNYGPTLAENEHFHGPIVFEIPDDSPRLDGEEADTLAKMAEYMTAKAAQEGWKGPNGEEFAVKIKFPKRGKAAKSGKAAAAASTGAASRSASPSQSQQVRKRRSRTQSVQVKKKAGSGTSAGIRVARSQSKFPYDQLKHKIPNRLGWAILLLRLQYILALLVGITGGAVLGILGRQELGLGGVLGLVFGGLFLGAISFVVGELVFVRGLRKCSRFIRTFMIVVSIIGILNPISWIVLVALLNDGTKQIFAIANSEAPEPTTEEPVEDEE